MHKLVFPSIVWPGERKKTVSDYKNAKEFHFVKDFKSQSKSYWAHNFKAHLHRKKEGRTGKNHKPTTLWNLMTELCYDTKMCPTIFMTEIMQWKLLG